MTRRYRLAVDDPGLADRIRHAAHVSQDSAVRLNPRVVGGVVVPDRLTVERQVWRYSSHTRASVRLAWSALRHPLVLWRRWWPMHVWWTREGLR